MKDSLLTRYYKSCRVVDHDVFQSVFTGWEEERQGRDALLNGEARVEVVADAVAARNDFVRSSYEGIDLVFFCW